MKYLFIALFTCLFIDVQAQIFERIKKKVEQKAEEKMDEILTSNKSAEASPSSAKRAETTFDFKPGQTVIFKDDLSNDRLGQMPKYWKTSGSGQLVTFPGVSGNWLLLKEFTSYKLDTLIHLPNRFTIEFDLLTRADQARDLNAFTFGFSKDNSVAGYEDGIISKTTLHFWNEEIINFSEETKLYNTQDYKLGNYTNAQLHISMQVDGGQMQIYVNDDKVLDAKMLDADVPKYFYFNPSTQLDNKAQLAVSNFKIAK